MIKFNTNLKQTMLVMLTLLVITIGTLSIYKIYIDANSYIRTQQNLSKDIIRFHIRANSDSKEDQALKLQVRDSVLQYLFQLLKDSSNINESKRIIETNKPAIIENARKCIREQGYEYEPDIYFVKEYFPVKNSGLITLPYGEYEALRIDIGDAKGHNWWCVLYPDICFSDITEIVAGDTTRDYLKEILSEEEYNMITEKTDKVLIKSKLLEFLHEGKINER